MTESNSFHLGSSDLTPESLSAAKEREAFEAWMRSRPGHQSLAKEYMNETSGRYDSPYTNLMWSAWLARSKATND